MVNADAEISRFLKGRRAVLTPRLVGLPEGVNRRRVRGLRREEVALRAGVSVDYYTRIEQGRGGRVSASVLDAIADALMMSGVERGYLHDLADAGARGPAEPAGDGRCVPPEAPRPRVRPALVALVDAVDRVPAMVLGRSLDLLVWNRMTGRLWPGVDDLPESELNLARMVFRDDDAEVPHVDPEAMRRALVAKLRVESARDPDDPRLCAVVMDLRRRSTRFAELWGEAEVSEHPFGVHRLLHPEVGELELHYSKAVLPGDSGQVLMTYCAEPGSPSEERLGRLARTPAPASGE
ncbi:helix-turn-helix protein [Nocardiopsis sp. Huas11]|uniref:helix-turn-helix transcriptional regulator n=1 Tax=Nocardiopsis sp. Huas11 TaxID=2183912 RepID=UPI000EB5419E|nr:helix-turn-helix transcriptional regulator [Nocardiopsis sp. Huas11]RKS06384.1 helix-turn-helix protein [Nocardiopsis sp. Huas11]